MNEKYTLTTIQDEAVPLASAPAGGSSLQISLLMMGVIAVLVVISVIILYRYLEQCRELRMRLTELDEELLTGAGRRYRYSRKWLSDALNEKEARMGGAAFAESRAWKRGLAAGRVSAQEQKI